jgi:tetratricopeptide (TPR) repeat protein
VGKEEFCDKKHSVALKYFNIEENYSENNKGKTKTSLQKLIKEDPLYLEPYLLLKDILECDDKDNDGDKLLDKAYNIALKTILDNKNQWPDKLEWDCQENRHLIRTFIVKGIYFWKKNEREKALDLFIRLLKSDPNDDCGVRYLILGIKEGLKYEDFNERFESEGFWDIDIDEWFFDKSVKFKEEFGWWYEAIKEV